MLKGLILLMFFSMSGFLSGLQAQLFSAVRYDTKDGLPSNTVYDISQDKDGFVWFATENGLSRFDGKNFRTFTTRDGLPDNSILKVHGDKNGRLYFTPFTHSLYYFENDSIHTFPVPKKYKHDVATVSAFSNMGESVVLSCTNDSYLLENGSIISFREKFHTTGLVYLVRTYDSSLIAGTTDTAFEFEASGGSRVVSKYNSTDFGLIFNRERKIDSLQIPPHSVLNGGGYLKNNLVFRRQYNHVLLFNSENGSLLYDIMVEKCNQAFIDSENNLWITTIGNGVYRYPSFNFRHVDFGGKNEIFSLAKMGGSLYAGSDYSKIFTLHADSVGSPIERDDYSNYVSESGNTVSHLTNANRVYVMRAHQNDLYIGTDAFLVRKTGNSPPAFRKIHPVKDIDIFGKQVLVCTSYNVLLLDENSFTVTDTLLKQRATCGVSYHGDFYVGTLGGLIKIDGRTRAITNLYDSFPKLRVRITSIQRGINDDMWIATSGFGLAQYSNGRILQTITEKDGLTSDICTHLSIDSTVIWLGTNKGLNRIEMRDDQAIVTRVTAANGLAADFINAVTTTDSSVYVGTAAGLNIFSKKSLYESSICKLHILSVSENGHYLSKKNQYDFPYNAINIRVDFTAISFKSAGNIDYYYRLEGLEEKWNETSSNFVNFPTLKPGNYTLLIKAVNTFGVTSETLSIRINVTPPWWQTWQFLSVVLIFVALLIIFTYWYNIRAIKRKAEAKREIETRFASLEQRALQAQMNPHFIFNALNSIQTFILDLDAEGANNYLTSFASLIRQTLENSMQSLITIEREVKYIETYVSLEKLRFRDKFRFQLTIGENVDKHNTVLPGMLLQPYIENALRHGVQHRKDTNGLISLAISRTPDDKMLYVIEDNGVGRKKAGELKSERHIEYQSRGTSISEKRIAAINNQFKTTITVNTEDIFDEKGEVGGTRVAIVIPTLEK